MDIDKALATQLANIEKRSGKPVAELVARVQGSGLAKHGEQVAMLKRDLGMGHGDANTIVHLARQASAPAPAADADPLDAIYSGAKAGLRPIHDRLVAAIDTFGPYQAAPKKGYVSLRRRKQFATIGPATRGEVEIGLNSRDARVGERFIALPPGGMCQFKTRVASPGEVDDALLAMIRIAWEEAG